MTRARVEPHIGPSGPPGSTVQHQRRAEALIVGAGTPSDPAGGRELMRRIADAGEADSLCRYAFLLEQGIGGPVDTEQSLALVHRAAVSGFPRACFELACRYADGLGLEPDPELARTWLGPAIAAGHPGALALAEELAAGPAPGATALSSLPPPRLLGDALPKPPRVEPLCSATRVYRVRDLLDRRWCGYLMQAASPKLTRSRVVRADGRKEEDAARTSEDMSFHRDTVDTVITWYRERIARLTYLPRSHQEPLAVLRYRAGGDQYRPHHDFFDPARGHGAAMVDGGQRIVTLLAYLNRVDAGGETRFPAIDLTVPPRMGEGLLFFNVRPDGSLDQNTRHAGLPVERGEKWVSTCWIRERERSPARVDSPDGLDQDARSPNSRRPEGQDG